nr:collagen alpha chain CG42342-like [Oncorhynchus nerka]
MFGPPGPPGSPGSQGHKGEQGSSVYGHAFDHRTSVGRRLAETETDYSNIAVRVTDYIKYHGLLRDVVENRSQLEKSQVVQGPPGPPGPPGAPGFSRVFGSHSNATDLVEYIRAHGNTVGPPGRPGQKGDIGHTGHKGERGLDGIPGRTVLPGLEWKREGGGRRTHTRDAQKEEECWCLR